VPAAAHDAPPPPNRKIQYSPYPAKDSPNRVYFGDTHLHTSYSRDAGMIGNSLGPEAAYRFARGETVTSSTGLPTRLQRPLDFLVITDHAENLGLAPAIAESNPDLLKNPWGREQHDLVKKGGNNLHRNVIFRDGQDKAGQVVPFSQYDSTDWSSRHRRVR